MNGHVEGRLVERWAYMTARPGALGNDWQIRQIDSEAAFADRLRPYLRPEAGRTLAQYRRNYPDDALFYAIWSSNNYQSPMFRSLEQLRPHTPWWAIPSRSARDPVSLAWRALADEDVYHYEVGSEGGVSRVEFRRTAAAREAKRIFETVYNEPAPRSWTIRREN